MQVDCCKEKNGQYIVILCVNHFQGFNLPNAYIAAQGPMPHTVSDFWRMVWEHKLVTIVMLTKCTEAGKVNWKCPTLLNGGSYRRLHTVT